MNIMNIKIQIVFAQNENLKFDTVTVNPKVTIKLKKGDKPGGSFIQDESTFAFLEKGNQCFREQKYDEAIGRFQQFVEKNPAAYQAYNVGEIYFSNQALDEALKYFEPASQIKPDWPDPYLKFGYVYLNKADSVNAVAKFEKLLTLESEGERAAPVKNILNAIKR
jgi:tetratricopeptide (TPR) repeat protein